jgi:serine/threonine-protein kinase
MASQPPPKGQPAPGPKKAPAAPKPAGGAPPVKSARVSPAESVRPEQLLETQPITGTETAKAPAKAPDPHATQEVGAGQTESEPSTPALAADAKGDELSTLKDFRLEKKLGEGGMGAVYKAHQISLDRVVAIKVPFKHLAKDPSFVQRFYREARVMAKLDHPNILRCFSVGEENGWHYLAMEYIDGASMQSWLDKLGKLPVADALHITICCAHALLHAHEQGLVHRDIKPDNILVTNKGVVKVADMGLAKALADDLSLSRTGTGAGTPHYMAPEQARDAKHVDGRSDIYALGSMLYCFLTGKPPFSGETYVELLLAKEKGTFKKSRLSNPQIPERLDLMLDKAIANKPEYRYQTCADFARDLESLNLAGETLSFIEGTSAARPRSAAGPASKPAAKPGSTTKPMPTKGVASAAAAGAKPGVGPTSVWFLRTVSEKGTWVKRKYSTAQIVEMIKGKDFDIESTVSRELKGPYLRLNQVKEFEKALGARASKAKADKRADQFHNAYDKILANEKSFYRMRWIKNKLRSAGGMVSFVIFLAALAGVGYLVFKFAWPYVSGNP